jgi:flagellar hook-length control protein FliK
VKASTTTQTVKKSSTQTEDKGFSKVLSNVKEEAKTDDKTITAEVNSNDKAVAAEVNNNDRTEAASNTEVNLIDNKGEALLSETKEVNEKDFIDLLELLLSLNGGAGLKKDMLASLQAGDLEKIKAAVSELLTNNLSGLDSDSLKSINLLITGKQLTEANLTTEELKQMVELLTDKLAFDGNFKTELSKLLQENGAKLPETDAETLKAALVNKFSDMVKKNIEVKPETENLMDSNQLKEKGIEVSTEVVNTAEGTNKSNSDSENLKDNFSSKEEKLLKDMLSSKDKGSKDSITDKITNVVNRFENLRLDKGAAVQDKPVITRNNFNLDFVKAIKFMDMNNVKELSVKIIPKDLGEIVIRLTMDNGVMKANVTATNKDTYNLLNSQLQNISNQLSEQNMTIQSFSLSLSNGENFLFNGNEAGQQESRQQGRETSKISNLENETLNEDPFIQEENSVNMLA